MCIRDSGYTSPDYPIYLNHNNLPTEIDKANAFADLLPIIALLKVYLMTMPPTEPLKNIPNQSLTLKVYYLSSMNTLFK